MKTTKATNLAKPTTESNNEFTAEMLNKIFHLFTPPIKETADYSHLSCTTRWRHWAMSNQLISFVFVSVVFVCLVFFIKWWCLYLSRFGSIPETRGYQEFDLRWPRRTNCDNQREQIAACNNQRCRLPRWNWHFLPTQHYQGKQWRRHRSHDS